MAALLQLGADVCEVVDLAVEGDPHVSVFVRQRLRARFEIDDAQPAMAESDPAVHVETVAVRPAMREHPRHRGEAVAIDWALAVEIELAGYATHVRTRLGRER